MQRSDSAAEVESHLHVSLRAISVVASAGICSMLGRTTTQ